MKLSIDSFGGNKDNYYNFKQCYLAASRQLGAASLYVNPFFRESTLGDLSNKLKDLRGRFDFVEFED